MADEGFSQMGRDLTRIADALEKILEQLSNETKGVTVTLCASNDTIPVMIRER